MAAECSEKSNVPVVMFLASSITFCASILVQLCSRQLRSITAVGLYAHLCWDFNVLIT